MLTGCCFSGLLFSLAFVGSANLFISTKRSDSAGAEEVDSSDRNKSVALVTGNERPDVDRERPVGAGVCPYRIGFGAFTGLIGLVGEVANAPLSSVVGFRSPAGFAATTGFFPVPFAKLLAPLVGLTGELRLSNRVTISVMEPLRVCEGRSAEGDGRSGFVVAAEGERRDRDEALDAVAYMDCGRLRSFVNNRRVAGRERLLSAGTAVVADFAGLAIVCLLFALITAFSKADIRCCILGMGLGPFAESCSDADGGRG